MVAHYYFAVCVCLASFDQRAPSKFLVKTDFKTMLRVCVCVCVCVVNMITACLQYIIITIHHTDYLLPPIMHVPHDVRTPAFNMSNSKLTTTVSGFIKEWTWIPRACGLVHWLHSWRLIYQTVIHVCSFLLVASYPEGMAWEQGYCRARNTYISLPVATLSDFQILQWNDPTRFFVLSRRGGGEGRGEYSLYQHIICIPLPVLSVDTQVCYILTCVFWH